MMPTDKVAELKRLHDAVDRMSVESLEALEAELSEELQIVRTFLAMRKIITRRTETAVDLDRRLKREEGFKPTPKQPVGPSSSGPYCTTLYPEQLELFEYVKDILNDGPKIRMRITELMGDRFGVTDGRKIRAVVDKATRLGMLRMDGKNLISLPVTNDAQPAEPGAR